MTAVARWTIIECFFEIFSKISNEFFQFFVITKFLFDKNTLLIAIGSDMNFCQLNLDKRNKRITTSKIDEVKTHSYSYSIITCFYWISHEIRCRFILKMKGRSSTMINLLCSWYIRSPSLLFKERIASRRHRCKAMIRTRKSFEIMYAMS